MVEGATIEDIRAGDITSVPEDRKNYGIISEVLKQEVGSNPLEKIDLVRAIAPSTAKYKDGKIRTSKDKKEYELKKLFVKYIQHYANKWDSMKAHPKQIKQKPAWFDYALSKFKDDEISAEDKKKIKVGLTSLWDFRDMTLPERVMGEEEANRQYGINSPYYTPPETSIGQESDIMTPTEDILSTPSTTEEYTQPTYNEPLPMSEPEDENPFGVRKIAPSGDSYLSSYIIPMRKTVGVTPAPNTGLRAPQSEFTMGITQTEKASGGSGSGAFSIGRNLFKDLRGKDSLQGIINQRKPNLPVQPVQVVPEETITVAPQPEIMQRKKKATLSLANRKLGKMSNNLSKFRSIELPTIPKPKMPMINMPNKKSNVIKTRGTSYGTISLDKIKTGKTKTSFNLNKNTIGNMSSDIRGNVSGVVGGINKLKQQVRGEFKSKETMKAINLKNIKSKKFSSHKDLNVLNKLKSETHNQISREALECKMIPKLKAQCDKVFTKNHITNEVSKFRNEFKDIGKMVPTVKGEKAKLSEVAMLGKSINHGVDGAQVADVRAMYKNSGSTKQMSIGRMEYDYSFVTGKKKPKIPDEYYEEGY